MLNMFRLNTSSLSSIASYSSSIFLSHKSDEDSIVPATYEVCHFVPFWHLASPSHDAAYVSVWNLWAAHLLVSWNFSKEEGGVSAIAHRRSLYEWLALCVTFVSCTGCWLWQRWGCIIHSWQQTTIPCSCKCQAESCGSTSEVFSCTWLFPSPVITLLPFFFQIPLMP